MSSARAVSKIKRILGEKTVGHMGTLDPMAEGVLIVGVGKATRLFDRLCGKKKTYIAKFTFGYETDTLDAFGEIAERTKDIPSVDAVIGAMRSLIGESEQMPPIYSAKHVQGKRAYALARSGESPELKPSRITIYDAQLVCQPKIDETVFKITCSAGTYIRSICRDVARMCGSLATLTYLQRSASGNFDVADSISFEELESKKEHALVSAETVLDLPRYDVPSELFDDLDHGRKIACSLEHDSLIYGNGIFFGVGKAENGVLKIKTYLRD